MEQDADAYKLERALILNVGGQHFLNKCFESDGLVTKYTHMLQSVPNNANTLDAAEAADLASARASCIKANLHILSGAAARELLYEYFCFFDFQSASWHGWRLVDDQRFAACLDMVCVMQDAFYRLVHRPSPIHEVKVMPGRAACA